MKRQTRTRLNRIRRSRRSRASVFGTAARPRISVFRSNRYFTVQLINDETGRTLAAFSTRGLEKRARAKKTEQAAQVGERVAAWAKETHVRAATLHRGPYRYHGQVQAFADAARKNGLML